LSIGDFNGRIQYIPLETDSAPLRYCSLVDFKGENILVSDRSACILFNLQGRILARMGHKGKGPGEYSLITNIKFGHHNQIVIQEHIFFFVFDLNGIFLNRFKPDINPEVSNTGGVMQSWTLFNDSLFLGQIPNGSGLEKYKAAFFNDQGKSVKMIENHIFLHYQKFYVSSTNSDADIFRIDGEIHFKEHNNDTLFRVTNQFVFKPVYYFDLGKFGPPIAVRELPMKEMSIAMRKYISINSLFETTQYIFLYGSFRDHSPAKRTVPVIYRSLDGSPVESWFYSARMLGIYDKFTEELVFAEPLKSDDKLTNDGLFNDFDGGVNFYPKFAVNDSTLAMGVDAYQLKEHVASKAFKNSTPKYPEKKKELQKLANNLSENDNPVLILCTFKK